MSQLKKLTFRLDLWPLFVQEVPALGLWARPSNNQRVLHWNMQSKSFTKPFHTICVRTHPLYRLYVFTNFPNVKSALRVKLVVYPSSDQISVSWANLFIANSILANSVNVIPPVTRMFSVSLKLSRIRAHEWEWRPKEIFFTLRYPFTHAFTELFNQPTFIQLGPFGDLTSFNVEVDGALVKWQVAFSNQVPEKRRKILKIRMQIIDFLL